MLLVSPGLTWAFGLCSLYFLYNAVTVGSFAEDKKKDFAYISDERPFQKNYRFEDFFWTGSEDDTERENSFRNQSELEISLVQTRPLDTWKTTTVFHTTTILFATVYPNFDNCKDSKQGCTPKISPMQTRSIEFFSPTLVPELSEILPCPTLEVYQTDSLNFPNIFSKHNGVERNATHTEEASTTTTNPDFKSKVNESAFREIEMDDYNVTSSTVFPILHLDQEYWIKTIFRSDNFSRNLELSSIETKLSTLYKKALRRRQEKYFGRNNFYERKDRKISQQVKVNILNVNKSNENVELLYYVSVADQPIPAMTAANDMRLITAGEVIAELGYPVLTKAEPYMKNLVPLGARVKGRTRDTWLFVGSVIAAVFLLLILAALFALELSKKRSKQSLSKELENRKHVFKEERGTRNLAFEGEAEAEEFRKTVHRNESKTESQSFGAIVKFSPEKRRESTSSSCSSSEASLVRLRQQRRRDVRMKETEAKPKPKPRTRVRKVENSDYTMNYEKTILDRSYSAINQNTFNQVTEEYNGSRFSPCQTRSPTSYLSMPSVKAFPRGTQIPESLNKILEPISIRHLDADSDSPNEYPHCSQSRHKVDVEHICEVKNKCLRRKAVTRHASLEGDDPGFIGPVVWNRHCEKVGQTVVSDGITMEETDENVRVGRMRKRFNELLDDALSMFGSRNPSPEGTEERSVKQAENRVYSAVVRPDGVLNKNNVGGRPKTTGSRRPQSAVVILGPRGAWETPSCSTLTRFDTAAVFQKFSPSPNIDENLIYVNSDLAPSDPAVPVIVAIKNELKKFEDPPHENS